MPGVQKHLAVLPQKAGEETDMESATIEILGKVRKDAPLVHNITNFVAMNTSANILLSVGASPIMAHSADEVGEMAAMAGALVLNIGTLDQCWLDAMICAGLAANEKGIPVVLDPVGAGATQFRTHAVEKIMSACRVSVVRGNVSEVLSLGSVDVQTRGVESSLGLSDAVAADLKALACAKNCIMAVSGKEDCITDGDRVFRVANGHELMTRVTGTGCGLSAVTAAFCAVAPDRLLEAAVAAFAFYGRCGELAAAAFDKPGSFYTAFLDCLYSAGEAEITRGLKITEAAGAFPGAGGND
jgi:hydroxyethylthiazole kinase